MNYTPDATLKSSNPLIIYSLEGIYNIARAIYFILQYIILQYIIYHKTDISYFICHINSKELI